MKKFFAILLSIILIFNVSVCAYADTPSFEHYQKTKEYLWQIVQDIGFIGTLPFRGIVELVNMFKHAKGITGEDVETEEEALDYAFEGISINGDNNIVLTDDAKQFINFWIDDVKNTDPYCYFFDLQKSLNTWGGTAVNAFADLVSMYPDKYIWVIDDNGTLRAGVINSYSNYYAVYYQNTTGNVPGIRIYEGKNTSGVNTADILVLDDINDGIILSYVNNQWIVDNTTYPLVLNGVINQVSLVPDVGSSVPLRNYGKLITTKGDKMLYFQNEQALLTYISNVGIGKDAYYINNSVYSNYSNSVGDFTITNDNRNTVTYGDITSYIDDHHTETGNYPTPQDINIYIESQQPTPSPTPTPTPLPDNPSGGGSSGGATASANNEGINININNNHNINVGIPSLSGNTVSGNGSGSSGGFFDWISDIGGVIGDFIKNVGQLFAEAIRGIAEAISSILETVPNVLSSIIEFVYGGLPDELKALVTLGITAVVFVSVIKILRK